MSDEQFIKLNEGIGINEYLPEISKVFSIIVGYNAVGSQTIASYLEAEAPPESLLFICIPGRELILRKGDPIGFRGIPYGDYSLGAMAIFLLELLNSFNRNRYYKPNFKRYREALIESLGNKNSRTVAIPKNNNI